MEEDITLSPHYYIVLKLLSGDSASPILGHVLFQKIAFLVLQNFPQLLQEADFKPHKLGPYSASLDESVKELAYQADIEDGKRSGLTITAKGKELLENLESFFDHAEHVEAFNRVIDDIKSDFHDFSPNEMLAFIYKTYPAYIDQSIKANDLPYEKLFAQLYERDLLGVSKIAELMGWTIDRAYQYLNARSSHVKGQ
jgi:uncharacterized protein YwgA